MQVNPQGTWMFLVWGESTQTQQVLPRSMDKSSRCQGLQGQLWVCMKYLETQYGHTAHEFKKYLVSPQKKKEKTHKKNNQGCKPEHEPLGTQFTAVSVTRTQSYLCTSPESVILATKITSISTVCTLAVLSVSLYLEWINLQTSFTKNHCSKSQEPKTSLLSSYNLKYTLCLLVSPCFILENEMKLCFFFPK